MGNKDVCEQETNTDDRSAACTQLGMLKQIIVGGLQTGSTEMKEDKKQ
jgi:hypothetical protein